MKEEHTYEPMPISIEKRSIYVVGDEPRPVPNIEREGNSSKVYGTLTWKGVTVREQIPIYVLREAEEIQAGYYRGVLLRLQRKLMSHLATTLGEP